MDMSKGRKERKKKRAGTNRIFYFVIQTSMNM